MHQRNIRDSRLVPLWRQSEDQQVAPGCLRMVPGIKMTGKLKEEEKEDGKNKIYSLWEPSMQRQRAQLVRVKQQSGFNMDSLGCRVLQFRRRKIREKMHEQITKQKQLRSH